MSLAELMARIGDDDDGTSSLTDVQIIGRLKSIHELRAEKHTFEPGQIVRHKFPDQMNNSRTARTPGLFVRYLDKPINVSDHPEAFSDVSDWYTMHAASQYDCVVGFIVDNRSAKANFVEFFETASDWRPATEADYGPIIHID